MVFRRIATGIIASLAVVSEPTMGIRMDRNPDLLLISDESTNMTFLLEKNEEQETKDDFPLWYMDMKYERFPCKYVRAASSIELKDKGNKVLYTISRDKELMLFEAFLQRQNLKADEESDQYSAGAFAIYNPPQEGSSEEAEEQKYQDDLIKAKADSLKEQQEVGSSEEAKAQPEESAEEQLEAQMKWGLEESSKTQNSMFDPDEIQQAIDASKPQSEEKKEEEINHCVICMAEEQLKEGDTIQLECGHGNEFHAKCLYTSVQHGPKPQCPLCRKEFPSETLDELEVAETQRILTLSQNQQ